jgi:EmrB/QacA subfamily drug resistance transporter
VFALASLASGIAPSTAVLIIARGVQGVGAAAMFATTIALLNTSYQGRERGLAFAIWGAINGAATAAGPILGGILTEGLSWRWIFFINLPISAVAMFLSVTVLSRDEPRRTGRIDFPGMLAFTLSAGALTYGLTRASEAGWGSTQTIAMLLVGAAALLAFGVIEARTRRPLLDLGLLRHGAFSAVLAVSFIFSIAAFAYIAYTSLWLQSVRTMSPIQAGVAFVPLSLAALAVSLSVGRYLHSPSARRWSISGGMVLIAIGALLQARLGAGSSAASIEVGLAIAGLGVGLVAPTLPSAALAALPLQLGGVASGALNTMRQLGYALGIAGLAVILQSRIGDSLSQKPRVQHPGALAKAVAGGESHQVLHATPSSARPGLDHAIHVAFASGLNGTLVIAGVAGLVGAAIAAVWLRPQLAHETAAQPSGAQPSAIAPSAMTGGVSAQRSAAGQTSR